MFVNLIYAGLALIPFVIFPGMNSRDPKTIVATGLAFSISLTALYLGKIKPFKNKWLLIFLFFGYVSIQFAPGFHQYLISFARERNKVSLMPTRDLANLWMYKSMFFFLVYSLMMISVASYEFTKKEVNRILFLMGLGAVLMSLYVIIQYFSLDQFFGIISKDKNPDVPWLIRPEIGGFMGQATVVAPFIAMAVPIAMYLKRYIWVAIMCTAVFITLSKVAIGSLAVVLLAYLFLSSRKYHRVVATSILLCLIALAVWKFDSVRNVPIVNESNGRATVWQEAWKDISTEYEGKKRAVTGFGPGSFYYSFSIRKGSRFHQLHNDWYELFYNFGIVGLIFFLLATKEFVQHLWRTRNEMVMSLSMSLLIVGLCCMGTFSMQIAPIIFYVIILTGLLYGEK